MSAAEYADLARDAALDWRVFIVSNDWQRETFRGETFRVYADGFSWPGLPPPEAGRSDHPVMSAAMTPANMTDAATLAEALYESAALHLSKDEFIDGLALLRGDEIDALLDERHGLLDHGDRP